MTVRQAELVFAYRLGLISSPLEEDREKRWKEYSSSDHEFGPSRMSWEAFQEAESTFFMTSFVLGRVKNHEYRMITDEDLSSFYSENMDLFTRAEGELFAFEEVRDIIIKRLREREYTENVEALALQHGS